MNFILQKDYELDDFKIELIKSKEYWEWRNCGKSIDQLTEINLFYEGQDLRNIPIKSICPVGRIDFVLDWFNLFWKNIVIKPKNIPTELLSYSNRKILNLNKHEDLREFNHGDYVFVKSRDILKSKYNGIYIVGEDKLNNLLISENLQISEYIDNVISEWRFFIYNKRIIDFKCYLGDSFFIPNKETILSIINDYKTSPISYTLDVMVTEKDTDLLEIHDFFSCGLYGFSDYSKYPFMLYRWFKEITANK